MAVYLPGMTESPTPGAIAKEYAAVDVNEKVAFMRNKLGNMLPKLEELAKKGMLTKGEKAAVDDMLTKLMRAGEEAGVEPFREVEAAFLSGRVDQIAKTVGGRRRYRKTRKGRKGKKRSTRRR